MLEVIRLFKAMVKDVPPFDTEDIQSVMEAFGRARLITKSVVRSETSQVYFSESGILRMSRLAAILRRRNPVFFDTKLNKANSFMFLWQELRFQYESVRLQLFSQSERNALFAIVAYWSKNGGKNQFIKFPPEIPPAG